MKSMHRLLWARYAEVHGKPVGIYLCPNTHTQTHAQIDGQTENIMPLTPSTG